ncbi:MAG TPA: cupin-like domain-containing protein [Steroidobacteraceae bacterium]|nr:cupin-like domain-containing protein [Steroidobacteraceae bacterium]
MLSPSALPERVVSTRGEFESEVAARALPVVMRGLVREWPMSRAAAQSDDALSEYVAGFHNGTPVSIMAGPPGIDGRLFYDERFRRLNFQSREAPFLDAMRAIRSAPQEAPPVIYMGSASEALHWPGLARANPLPLLPPTVIPNLWMGNRAVVGPHNDAPDNIACVVAGRRRFRLFPPEQFANLYIGPRDLNPAGRPVSFVSVNEPDLALYPRYASALAASREAVLEAGDAIYIPSMWWHSVESLAPFNLLVNYWWESGTNATRAEAALIYTLLAMENLRPGQKAAWKAVFDHLAFRADDEPVAHIPPEVRGWLGTLTPDLRDQMRNFIRRSLLD